MHPLVQSMGREITCQQSLKEPGQRSRLWYYKDSLEILSDQTGTGVLEGVALDMNMTNACQTELQTVAFSMMRKLRLLKLNNVQLSGGYTDFPKKLKWLTWHNFSLRALPNGFPLSSLVAIDMQSSKLQRLVQGNMLLGSLKFLNLSHSHDLVKSPNFAEFNALEQLILEDCVSLIEIDESIGMAEGLVLLDIKDCKLLKRLPKNIYKLKCLETLIISGCSNIRMLDAEMKNMESLKDFHADGLDFGNSSYRNQKSESWLDFFQGLVSKPRRDPEPSLTSLPFNSITLLSLAKLQSK
ncbi:disease resistance protein TAO1-like isoform X1 [Daucus carota subsp. sativus]|uniref:disease resistance protein TAO1-like isoform X1 n=1 Tax=Daucus carota subsp. sativus TaxID=79200 RepID=UPI0030835DFF